MNHETGAFPEVSRFSVFYGTPSFLRKVGQAIQIGRGIHDYVNYFDCGSIDNYIIHGGNPLIDQYLELYPKK